MTFALIVLILPSAGVGAQPVPGRVVVQFADSLTQCAHCLLEQGQPFSSALTDGSGDIDYANATVGVTAAHDVFFARHGMTTDEAEQAWAARLAEVKNRFPARTRRIHKNAVAPTGLVNVYELEVPPTSNPVDVCYHYLKSRHVEWCVPDVLAETTFVPNDPFFASRGSWGQSYQDMWGLSTMSTTRAWNTSLGSGVTVAVVDSGLDVTHPDIAANVWTNTLEIPSNGVDDDGNGCVDDVHGCDFVTPGAGMTDPNGHGTHVAGTIAAVGNNGEGVIGVAPNATVMPVRAFDAGGNAPFARLGSAIQYAAFNGADVINNSWGCTPGAACFDQPAVETAVRLAGALGVVVVFAAGNDKRDVYQISPQNMTDPLYKPVVVAAHDNRRRPAEYPGNRGTNFGPTVDVMAAGGGPLNVEGIDISHANVLSLRSQQCPPEGTGPCLDVLQVPAGSSAPYSRLAGTSMAAPHVSGLAALVASCNPALRSPDIRHIVQAAARRRISDDLYGNQAVSAYGALELIAAPTVAITAPSRFQTFSGGAEVEIKGDLSGPEVHSWRVYVADRAPARPSDYKRIASGKGPVTGTIARWTPLQPGNKSVKVRVRTMLPADRPTSATYLCGDPRPPQRLRSRYLQEVQFFTVEGQAGPELPVQRVTASDGKHYQMPSVAGSRVVAEQRDTLGGPAQIYARDLAAGQPPGLIGAPGSTDPSLDDGNANRMVWIDPRSGGPEIWLYDFSAGTSTQLTTSGRIKSRPRISGNWVAFNERQADGRFQVALHDLANGTTSLLTSGDTILSMAMSGDWLVWRASGQSSSLTARRLSTGDTTTVQTGYDTSCMDVSGDWVVSLTHDGFFIIIPYGRIMVRNLVTQQSLEIDGGIFDPQDGVFGCPSIDATLVGYTRLLGMSTYPHYRDFLVAGPPTRITFEPSTLARGVDVSGDRLVWEDSRGDIADQIWTYTRE